MTLGEMMRKVVRWACWAIVKVVYSVLVVVLFDDWQTTVNRWWEEVCRKQVIEVVRSALC